MFATEESTPWYRSIAGVVGLSILLPPAGLALLWLRRESSTKSKLLATLGIVVLSARLPLLRTAPGDVAI